MEEGDGVQRWYAWTLRVSQGHAIRLVRSGSAQEDIGTQVFLVQIYFRLEDLHGRISWICGLIYGRDYRPQSGVVAEEKRRSVVSSV